MTGYTPAEQDIRAQRGLPYATGADQPPAWHDQPEMTITVTVSGAAPLARLRGPARYQPPAATA